MMKKLGVIFLLFFLSAELYSQVITGTIKDNKGDPVNNASVSMIDTASKRIIAYTFSTSNGKYSININQANADWSKLAVKVQIIGFKKEIIPLQSGRLVYDFSLTEETIQLPQVLIKEQRPTLILKGDTTSYKVSDFSNPQDRVIGDVLRRLPGIDVDATGRISYNGQPINSFNIDDDDFLGGKYNIGTNSIPNMIVDMVQIIEHYEPVKVLRKNSTSTAIALNITLKDNAKKKPIDQVMLSGGLPELYNGSLTNMLFKKPFNAINQYKLNNVGDDLNNDLISHIPVSSDNAVIPSLVSASNVSYPSFSKSRYLFNNIGLLNTNNSYKLKNDFQLKMKLSYLYDKQDQNYNSTTTLFLPADTINYDESLSNLIKPRKLSAEFTLTANKDSYYFNNVLTFEHNTDLNNASLLTNSRILNQHLSNTFTNFYNQFTVTIPVKGKKPMTVFSYISDYKFPQKLTISPAIYPAGFNLPQTLSELTQQVSTPTFYTNNYLNFTIPTKITQSYKLGASWQSQKLSSQLTGQPVNSTQNIPADSAQNNLIWNRYKFYAETNFSYKAKKLTISFAAPFSFQQTNFSNSFFKEDEKLSKFYLNPALSMQMQTGKENNINLNYRFANEPGNIDNAYSGYILTGYRSLRANNTSYESDRQSVTLGYTFRRSVKLFFFNLNASYSSHHSNTIPFSEIDDNFSINNTILSSANQRNNFTISSGTSKYLFDLHTTLSGNYSWQYSRSNQYFNQVPFPYDNYSQMMSMSLDSKINKKLFLKYSGTYSHSASQPAHSSVAKQTSNRLSQQADMTWLPVTVVYFKVSMEHLYNPNKNVTKVNSYFADATLQYKINKYKMDVEFSLLNIANTKVYNITTLSANSLSVTSYPLRGRIALMKATFNL